MSKPKKTLHPIVPISAETSDGAAAHPIPNGGDKKHMASIKQKRIPTFTSPVSAEEERQAMQRILAEQAARTGLLLRGSSRRRRDDSWSCPCCGQDVMNFYI